MPGPHLTAALAQADFGSAPTPAEPPGSGPPSAVATPGSPAGRTITRRLTESQARLYQEWIANRRCLGDIIAEMEKVSEQAGEILLQQPDFESSTGSATWQLGEPRAPSPSSTSSSAGSS
jgi:hypothetical protein